MKAYCRPTVSTVRNQLVEIECNHTSQIEESNQQPNNQTNTQAKIVLIAMIGFQVSLKILCNFLQEQERQSFGVRFLGQREKAYSIFNHIAKFSTTIE
jgi:hypothetical protein